MVGPRALVPAPPDDPFAFRDFRCECDDALHRLLLGLNIDEINPTLFFAKPDDVRVRINQTRNHRRALQINHASPRPAIFFGVARTPDKDDPRSAHGDRFGVRPPTSR
jgi:hypothetical protein